MMIVEPKELTRLALEVYIANRLNEIHDQHEATFGVVRRDELWRVAGAFGLDIQGYAETPSDSDAQRLIDAAVGVLKRLEAK